jgi:hypothetical protein
MRAHLAAAPWFLVSIAIHVGLAFILANLCWLTLRTDQQLPLNTDWEEAEHAMLERENPEPDDEEVDPIKDPPDSPEVVEGPEEEWTDDDSQEPLSDEKGFYNILGLGGGFKPGKLPRKVKGRFTRKTNAPCQTSVDRGLDWLARHQVPEGFWDCDGFDLECTTGRCTGRGMPLCDVGVTGLALLAFLGAGNTPTFGTHKATVRKGIRYLCDQQDPETGCLSPQGTDTSMYNHAIACLALTEAYGLSRWPPLKKHARAALRYIHDSKNPGKAWRYNNGNKDPHEQNDVSVTGWMIMCLTSAKDFGLPFYEDDLVEALLYIDAMTDTATGRTGYKERGSLSSREAGDELLWPVERTESMTGVALFCRYLCAGALNNLSSQEEIIQKGAKLLLAKRPQWNVDQGTIDYYYWYYGSYALYQRGGSDWKSWMIAMVKAVEDHQCTQGCEKGSWDPQLDPWGDSGGRVYATALCVLCLEVFYRYDSVVGGN